MSVTGTDGDTGVNGDDTSTSPHRSRPVATLSSVVPCEPNFPFGIDGGQLPRREHLPYSKSAPTSRGTVLHPGSSVSESSIARVYR